MKRYKLYLKNPIYFLLLLFIILISGCSGSNKDDAEEKSSSGKFVRGEDVPLGEYVVGEDLPSGEYIFFANSGKEGELRVYDNKDDNSDDAKKITRFEYNTIHTAVSGDYLVLKNCYAVPFSKNPEINTTGSGMFKVGTHIKAGEYRIIPDPGSKKDFYYSIRYNDGNYTGSNFLDPVKNKSFKLLDGDYIEIKCAHLEYNDTSEVSIKEITKSMKDKDKYATAVDYYEKGDFNSAILYLKAIKEPDIFRDMNEIIKKCKLMKKFQGVHKSTVENSGRYLALDGWHLYQYKFFKDMSNSTSKYDKLVSIIEYDGQYFLVEKKYEKDLNNAFMLYALIETDDKQGRGIDIVYLGKDSDILYVQDAGITLESLEDEYQNAVTKK